MNNRETLTLMPQLPDGEEDTGHWLWNTGETTRNITVTTDKSYVYRVTYTNRNGIESQLCFPIAAKGDSNPDSLISSITIDGTTIKADGANTTHPHQRGATTNAIFTLGGRQQSPLCLSKGLYIWKGRKYLR